MTDTPRVHAQAAASDSGHELAPATENPREGAPVTGARARVRRHLAVWWPVWVAYAASRLGVLAVGVLAAYASRARELGPVVDLPRAGTFIHYADVVTGGYTLQNATEYPLLPLAMKALSLVGVPLAAGAMLITNIAFLVGLLAFASLGERYVGREAAVRGATYLAIFPTAYWFSLASTESLMLATLCGAALLALRGTPAGWIGAGTAAAACALTRPPAVFVVLVLAALAIAQWRSGHLARRTAVAAAAALAMVPAALVGFFAYMHAATGDAFAPMHAQRQFGRSMSLAGPWNAVTSALEAVRGGTLGPGFELAAAALIALAIVVFALRRTEADRIEVSGWVAFAAASLMLPLATGLVWQMPRFALLVPPLFWLLGTVGRRQWIHQAMLILFPMALAFRVVFEVAGVRQ